MTDKERILMEVVAQLAITQLLAPIGRRWGRESFVDPMDKDRCYTHFAYWDEPKLREFVRVSSPAPINKQSGRLTIKECIKMVRCMANHIAAAEKRCDMLSGEIIEPAEKDFEI